MKFIPTLLIFFFVGSLSAQNIIKVDNRDVDFAEYTTLQEAIDAAEPNDIIQLYPSPDHYGNGVVDKPLQIVGPGYYQALNSELGIRTNLNHAQILGLTFRPGSEGSKVQGMVLNTIACDTVSNVVIERNRVQFIVSISHSIGVMLLKNLFNTNNNSFKRSNIEVFESDNVIISNNIVMAFNADRDYKPNTFGCNNGMDNVYVHANCTGLVFENNIFRDRCTFQNSIIKNNIFLHTESCFSNPVNGSNNLVFNNVSAFSDDYGDPSNLTNVDPNSIFVGYPTIGEYSPDSRYSLAPGSPAIGAGEGGVDCGVFGGDETYKLSGIPSIPLVYELNVPTSRSEEVV